MLVSLGLRVYLHFANSYSATYGSLGAVIVLMLWFYLTSAAVLIGAEVNSELESAAKNWPGYSAQSLNLASKVHGIERQAERFDAERSWLCQGRMARHGRTQLGEPASPATTEVKSRRR